MASLQWFRSRQIVCVTAGCLMLAGQARGQSNPPSLLGTPASSQTATGQFVNRVFRDDEGEHKYVVFVPADEERTFRVVPVAVGHRSSGLAEIASGLADGDAVVTAGAFLLKSQLLRAELQEEE